MRNPATMRPLLLLARLAGIAGVSLVMTSIVNAVFLLFRYGPDWNFGIIPLVFLLQIIIAAWVVRGVFRLDPRPLLRVLLLAGGISFFGLYGWYFLLAGEGGEWISFGNLLYLVAGLLVGIHLAALARRGTAV